MDALLQEIAKTFNIGNEAIQNIIDNYPQLRQQIATYNFMVVIQGFMFVIATSSFIAFIWSTLVGVVNTLEYTKPQYLEGAGKGIVSILTKVAIVSFIIFVVSSIVFVVATYIQTSQAPDVVVIKSLLEQTK